MGGPLRLLGYMRQRIPSNWKLMFENIKDPYHASLMHVFLVTFGLFRADQPSAVYMDATGRHACLISRRGEQRATSDTGTSATCARILHYTIHVFWRPCASSQAMRLSCCRRCGRILSFSKQSNTLAMRQIAARSWGLRVIVDIFRLRG